MKLEPDLAQHGQELPLVVTFRLAASVPAESGVNRCTPKQIVDCAPIHYDGDIEVLPRA